MSMIATADSSPQAAKPHPLTSAIILDTRRQIKMQPSAGQSEAVVLGPTALSEEEEEEDVGCARSTGRAAAND
jgi:hypothetical protein